MADSGFAIRRGEAGAVAWLACVGLAASLQEDSDRELLLLVLQRALPAARTAPQISQLAAEAEAVLAAARDRRRPSGAAAWARALAALQLAVARACRRRIAERLEEV